MSTAELKSNLHKLIDAIQDSETLNSLYNYLTRTFKKQSPGNDGWDKLTPQQQKEIEEAIKSLEKKEGIPHEKVMAKYSKYLK